MTCETVRLDDSAIVWCADINPRHAVYWARGENERPVLGDDLQITVLEAEKHRSHIKRGDDCILAARIVLTLGYDVSVPCAGCDNSDKVMADPMVQALQNRTEI